MTSHSDPSSGLGLPSPETLKQLEEISPGFIQFLQTELVAHREAQQKSDAWEADDRRYRRETERILAKRGQLFGFAIGVVAIGAGTLAALNKAQIAGTFIGAGGVIGLVTVFVVKNQLLSQTPAAGGKSMIVAIVGWLAAVLFAGAFVAAKFG